jgi:hypothetical protein
MELFDIDWSQVTSNLIHLGIAFVFALPIAWNRERYERGAGLRTFPLVAVASCGFMLQGMSVLDTTDSEAQGNINSARHYSPPRPAAGSRRFSDKYPVADTCWTMMKDIPLPPGMA